VSATRVRCLELLCRESKEFALYPSAVAAVVESLRCFHRNGWLSKKFRFPNKDGLQHRIQFYGSGAKWIPLLEFLAKEIGLDFTEVNADGGFPLSLAIQRSNPRVILYLLREGLVPSKAVRLKYRLQRDTLLTLLYRCPGSSAECREICERIGLDVIRALGKIECQLNNPRNHHHERTTLPLAFAFFYWPPEAVRFLVEDVGLEGSEPGSPSMQQTPSETSFSDTSGDSGPSDDSICFSSGSSPTSRGN
jgi:hypothetical protein